MKGIETVGVYSHITFSALFRSVLSTVRTSALCWAVGKKVAAIVQADFFWNTLSQSLWSTRTSHSCWLGMAHEIHAYHVSSKCQQVQWSVLPRWCLAIQQPSILDRKVQRVCKQGPPPFLRSHGDAICWHILICSVNTTHSVVVNFDDSWLIRWRFSRLHRDVQPTGSIPTLLDASVTTLLSRHATTTTSDDWSSAYFTEPREAFSREWHFFSGQSSSRFCRIVPIAPSPRARRWSSSFTEVKKLSNVVWYGSDCGNSEIRSSITDPPNPKSSCFATFPWLHRRTVQTGWHKRQKLPSSIVCNQISQVYCG